MAPLIVKRPFAFLRHPEGIIVLAGAFFIFRKTHLWLSGIPAFIICVISGIIIHYGFLRAGRMRKQAPGKIGKHFLQKLLSEAFDISAVGMAIVWPEGKFLKVNRQLCDMLGYTENELLAITFKDITYKDDVFPDVEAADRMRRHALENYKVEKRYVHKNGNHIWVNITVSPIKDQDGNIVVFTTQVEDISEKKKAFELLKERKNQLRAFVESGPAAMAMFDNNMNYLMVSDKWLSENKFKREEIIGKNHYDVFPTMPERWKEIHKRCLAGAVEKSDEDYFVREDGIAEWHKWEIRPWQKTENEIGGIIIRSEIITAIKEADLNFKHLVERSLVGVYVYQDGKYPYANPKFAEIFGYSQEEFINYITAHEIIYEEDLPIIQERIRDRIERRLPSVYYQARAKKKDGSIIWFEVNGTSTYYKGAPAIIGTLQDITERKKAEASILHEKDFSESIINGLPGIFYMADKDGNFKRWNKNVEIITGYSSSELAGMHTTDLLFSGDVELAVTKRKEAFEKGIADLEIEVLTKKKERKCFYITIQVVKYNGEDYTVGIGIDLTEKKLAEAELLKRNWEIGERVKELRCLFRLSELISDNTRSIDDILKGCLDIVPAAYQYPDITCLRICFGDKEFKSAVFRETRWKQSVSIISTGKTVGEIEVFYTEERGWESEKPFLDEEKSMISSVAGMLANAVQKRITDVELKDMAHTFQAILENATEAIFLLSTDWKVLRLNKEAKERILNIHKRKIDVGSDLRDFFYPDSASILSEMFNLALNGKASENETCNVVNGQSFWIRTRTYPVYDSSKNFVGVALLSENITKRKEHEEQITLLSRIYKFVSEINESMLRSESEQRIYEEACRAAIAYGDCSMAWIGHYDAATDSVKPSVWAGHEDGYLDAIKISPNDPSLGSGPTSRAVRTQTLQFCNDIDNDPAMAPWRAEALKRNYHSSVAIPIILENGVHAVFTLYMSKRHFFNDVERKLLAEITNSISFALDKMRLKKLHEKAQAELIESEEKFRKFTEGNLAGVYVWQDKFVYVNPQFEKVSGYSRDELLNEINFRQLIDDEDVDKISERLFGRLEGKELVNHYVLRTRRKDGVVRYVELVVSVISYQAAPAVLGTVIDITDRIEEEKRISKAVTDAQEEERQQISMELHDNVKQIMAAVLLNIDFMKMNLKDEQKVFTITENVSSYVREAIEEIRKISHRLAPSVDPTLSIHDKIKSIVGSMNESKNISVNYSLDRFRKNMRGDIQLTLYRILQEQFTNIMKYANATSVNINLHKTGGNLVLCIEDDGNGFDTKSKKRGIGLENIRRRVTALNGKMQIISSPGNGCSLIAKIPLAEN